MTESKVVRESRLCYKEGNSDKVYIIELRQQDPCTTYQVRALYGRRGANLVDVLKSAPRESWVTARQIFYSLIKKKEDQGYKYEPGFESVIEFPSITWFLRDLDRPTPKMEEIVYALSSTVATGRRIKDE